MKTKNGKIEVEEVSVPSGTLVEALLPTMSDHTDAFRVVVDRARFPDVDSFAYALTKSPPPWVAAAMRARDAVMGFFFGLKTSRDALEPTKRTGGVMEIGDFAGIFRLRERTANELLLGEDDRHLDFRLSLLYEPNDDDDDANATATVTVTTVVRFNNTLGRAYFLPVRPAHRIIVPAMIRSAVAVSAVAALAAAA